MLWLWKQIQKWYSAFLRLLGGYDRRWTATTTNEVPDNLRAKTVYIIGENGYQWKAVFHCPCGCGELIQLNLTPEGRPRWDVTKNENQSVTIRPSINRVRGCCSHFILRNGTVEWVRDGRNS